MRLISSIKNKFGKVSISKGVDTMLQHFPVSATAIIVFVYISGTTMVYKPVNGVLLAIDKPANGMQRLVWEVSGGRRIEYRDISVPYRVGMTRVFITKIK